MLLLGGQPPRALLGVYRSPKTFAQLESTMRMRDAIRSDVVPVSSSKTLWRGDLGRQRKCNGNAAGLTVSGTASDAHPDAKETLRIMPFTGGMVRRSLDTQRSA